MEAHTPGVAQTQMKIDGLLSATGSAFPANRVISEDVKIMFITPATNMTMDTTMSKMARIRAKRVYFFLSETSINKMNLMRFDFWKLIWQLFFSSPPNHVLIQLSLYLH